MVGGAAIAAYRLHRALRLAGVHSTMLVDWKAGTDPDVQKVDRRWSRTAMLSRRLIDWRIRWDVGKYRNTQRPSLEKLTDDRNAGGTATPVEGRALAAGCGPPCNGPR